MDQITVAICTWNRCELLRQTLEQMTKLIIPPQVEWELLVVNNNSTDETDTVIASFTDRLPIRRLFEPQPGKSHALNLAIRHVTGEYILWTDDDVLVEEQWLAEYYKAFRRRPEATLFGGPVDPWFAGRTPQWLLQTLPQVSVAYAVRDFGAQPIALSIQENIIPFGANFAIRTEEQRQCLYNSCLGPKPNNSVRGEETAVIRTILEERGSQGWWVPTARVRHYIPQSRQTIRYLRSFYFGAGEGAVLMVSENNKAGLFGKPRWLWRLAIEAEVRYRLHRLFSNPTVWIEDLKKASYWWGHLGMSAFYSHQR